jgi:hypothetical protein
MQSVIEDGEWMRIKKRRAMPGDRRAFVIKLDVTGSKVRMIGVLMEAKHQVLSRFDPVDAVVFMIDASGVPEAYL